MTLANRMLTLLSRRASGERDPYFSNVVALLHFDGANNSTTFTDQTGKVWTRGGNSLPVISTAQSVFGGASGLFTGVNVTGSSYLTSPSSTDFNFGTGAFTIEGRVRPTSVTALNCGYFSRPNADASHSSPVLIYQNSDSLLLYASSTGTSWDVANAVVIGTLSLNTWASWAVTRSGNTFRTFFNGVQASTFTSAASLMADSGNAVVGAHYETNGNSVQGYMEEMRITKGVARYTGNYTIATSAFPNS